MLYYTTPVEANLIPVNITCDGHPIFDVFTLSLIIHNIKITVDKETPQIKNSTDLWNISVSGLFDNRSYLVGKGQIDCSLVDAIECEVFGLYRTVYKRLQFKPNFEFEFDGKTLDKSFV